jgi:hypothetical protein
VPPKRTKKLVYNLFQQLKQNFNGDLFGDDLSNESHLVKDAHISTLTELLRGDDLSSGQLALSFWAYDFRFERKYKQAQTSFIPTSMVMLCANEAISLLD